MNLKKIAESIAEVGIYGGKVKEILISKVSKDELKEARETLGFKCSSADLGYFSFCIKYAPEDGGKTRTMMIT